MYNEKIENLIKAALADGVLTEKEKQVLFKNAQAQGIDLDEFEMILDARLVELEKAEKEKAQKSAPKSDKFGDVRKCPACGTLVPALATLCPDCGYEFSGVQASSSSQQLAKLISDASVKLSNQPGNAIKNSLARETAVYDIVNSFPIPNTKSDLFDLMMFLKGQGYLHKFKECENRARYLFPNDPLFEKVIKDYKNEQKKDNKEIILLLLGLFGFLLLIGLIYTFFE